MVSLGDTGAKQPAADYLEVPKYRACNAGNGVTKVGCTNRQRDDICRAYDKGGERRQKLGIVKDCTTARFCLMGFHARSDLTVPCRLLDGFLLPPCREDECIGC